VLLEFLGRATVAVCATRDARLVPRVRYACGWRAEPDSRVLRVMIQEAHCAGLTESLAENGELAVTIEEIGPHEAYQFKGTVLEAQPCSEGDLAFVAQVRERFVQAISRIFAIPDDAIRAYFQWPGVALRMQVREIFVQTPGPGAGRRLVPPEERP
jgi:hypothetical protein